MNILRKSSLILAGTAVAGLLAFACADNDSVGGTSSEINANFAKGLVIAKVYAGFGVQKAPLDGDYVQLYNATDHGIPRKLLSLQIAGGDNAYGSAYSVDLADPANDKAEIGSGKYFLIALTPGAKLDGRHIDVTATAPALEDGGSLGPLALAVRGGSVALVNKEDPIDCERPEGCATAGAISVFGYGKIGDAAPLAETKPFVSLESKNAAARKLAGCWVKTPGDNSKDFTTDEDYLPFDKDDNGLDCRKVDAGSEAPNDAGDSGSATNEEDGGSEETDAGKPPTSPDAATPPTSGNGDEGEEDEAPPPVAGKKKKTNYNPDTQPIAQSKSSGCSSAPGTGGNGIAGALGIGLALAALGRRKK